MLSNYAHTVGVAAIPGVGRVLMNLEEVVFGFFIVLAATLNFGFVIGEIDNPCLLYTSRCV